MIKKILFISNGKGEDSIAVTIIDHLKNNYDQVSENQLQITAIPLIGNGDAYRSADIKVLKSWGDLPNDGFFSPLSIIFHLLFGKLFKRFLSQRRLIANIKNNYDAIINVGDFYTVLLAAVVTGKTTAKNIHIATAMSNYLRPFNFVEKWVFKNKLSFVFTRDEITAHDLLDSGINATYYGNPMMDDKNLQAAENNNLSFKHKKKNVMLIPSSRNDAYQNLRSMARCICKLGFHDNIFYFTSIHPRLKLSSFTSALRNDGWIFEKKENSAVKGFFHKKGCNKIVVLEGSFRELLEHTNVAIGMTGTGNEQVVGVGVPLILLKGKSKSSSKSRLKHYKKLLGDSVFIAPFWKKENAILEIIQSSGIQKKMREEGLMRMGSSGGTMQIARKIKELIVS